MILLHTIKNSPHVKPLIEFIQSKKFKVEQIAVDKYSIHAPDVRTLAEPLADYLAKAPKEMEINTVAKVGFTVFAYLQNGKGGAYILTNDKGHKKQNKRRARQVKLLLL
jgi:hypothetical protein